jgi:hypothetical protein
VNLLAASEPTVVSPGAWCWIGMVVAFVFYLVTKGKK